LRALLIAAAVLIAAALGIRYDLRAPRSGPPPGPRLTPAAELLAEATTLASEKQDFPPRGAKGRS